MEAIRSERQMAKFGGAGTPPVYCSTHLKTVLEMEPKERPRTVEYKRIKREAGKEQRQKLKEWVKEEFIKDKIWREWGEDIESRRKDKEKEKENEGKVKEIIRDIVDPKIFISKSKLNEIWKENSLIGVRYSKKLDKIWQWVEVLLEYINSEFEQIEKKDFIRNRIVFTIKK